MNHLTNLLVELSQAKEQFQPFSGLDYLLIDIANNLGHDKKSYEERIQIIKDWLPASFPSMGNDELVELVRAKGAEEPTLTFAGLKALQDHFNNKPSGYMVAFDAVASGTQIMSALTGDVIGLYLTGALGNKRNDVYTAIYEGFKELCGTELAVTRSDLKVALMTYFYGSVAEPLKVLQTPANYKNFITTVNTYLKGASFLRNLLVENWDATKDVQNWKLPDGFTAYCPVMKREAKLVKVAGVEVEVSVNVQTTSEYELSNAANVVHSVDGLLMREVTRRCNYDVEKLQYLSFLFMQTENLQVNEPCANNLHELGKLGELIKLHEESKFASVRILDYINSYADILALSYEHRMKLQEIVFKMNQYRPFEVIGIHDSYKCKANNMNYVRYWYNDCLANLTDSNMLCFLVNQVLPVPIASFTPNNAKEIAQAIRNSNYAIC